MRREEGEYRTLVVDGFGEGSEQNHLRLNVDKTMIKMVINFGRKKMPLQPLQISGRGGGLQIPGSCDQQQTGLEI